MYGVCTSWPSRTIALCPAYWLMIPWTVVGSPCGFSCPFCPALTRPRLYSSSVIRLNASEPLPVNCRVTIGRPEFWSFWALIPDSTRSLPVSAGGSLNRYQYLPSFEVPFDPAPGQLPAPLQKTGCVFSGTFSTSVPGGCFPSL